MEIILSEYDLTSLSAANSLDKYNHKDITSRLHEDCINATKQETKSSSRADTKESEEVGNI